MWNTKIYKSEIEKAKKRKVFCNKKVHSKEDIYNILAVRVSVSYDTVKSWTRPTNNGPSDTRILRKLEEVFELPFGSFEKKEDGVGLKENESEVNGRYHLTDINKKALHFVYQEMKRFVCDENRNNDVAYQMLSENLKDQYLLIPNELYKKIDHFMEVVIAPLVYEPSLKCFKHDTVIIGYIDDDGLFHLEGDEEEIAIYIRYMVDPKWIKKIIWDFAKIEFYPYLVGKEKSS